MLLLLLRTFALVALSLPAVYLPSLAATRQASPGAQTEPAFTAKGCVKSKLVHPAYEFANPLRFGLVNLASPHLQPPGSLLASTVVPSTAYTALGANPDTILWQCPLATLPDLHYLVATFGASRFGGHNEIGAPDNLADVYATWFDHIGIRMKMEGVAVTRTWQRVALKRYDIIHEDGKALVAIRVKHLPVMSAELYRVSQPVPPLGGTQICGSESRIPNAHGTPCNCFIPNAYLHLSGPGIGHDFEGEDSAYHTRFYGGLNGIGYRMTQHVTLSRSASCAVRNATPHVIFPTASVAQLQAGAEISAPFSVHIECEDAALRPITDLAANVTTTLGIQVSPGAWQAAQTLGLVNSSGGVQALVSDQYGHDARLAQGVGIRLQDEQGQPLMWAGLADQTPLNPARAGWYPVWQGAQKTGASGEAGHTFYQRHFSATLHRLPGQTVTSGRIHATAYVVVKVQ